GGPVVLGRQAIYHAAYQDGRHGDSHCRGGFGGARSGLEFSRRGRSSGAIVQPHGRSIGGPAQPNGAAYRGAHGTTFGSPGANAPPYPDSAICARQYGGWRNRG